MTPDIRQANPADQLAIARVHTQAFPESENTLIAALAGRLLAEPSVPSTLHLVALHEQSVIGHVAFSPVFAEGCNTALGYILAPLAVSPAWQKQGVGSALVRSGLEHMQAQGAGIVFVYGDPQVYGRFGFSGQVAEAFEAPHPLEFAFGWQAVLLDESVRKSGPTRIACVPALSDPSLW